MTIVLSGRILLHLFPVRHDVTVTQVELSRIVPRVPLFERRFRLFFFSGTLVSMAAITIACCVVIALTQQPIENPVWDHRGGLPMALPAFFLAGPIALAIGRLVSKWYWGDLFEIYDRYQLSTSRFDHRRADKWLSRHYPLSEVTAIERYDNYRAPIGTVNMANLRLIFSDGASVSIRKRTGQTEAAALDSVAEFIANQSKLPVHHADIPPL